MYYGERFNAISHMVGAVASIGALVTMVVIAAGTSDPYRVVGASVFGATLVLLYVISTLYHSVKGRSKNVLQKFDHCAIYLLIAGSYTPFCLISLRGAWGWSLLGVVWGLAALGVVQEIWLARGARILSLVLYVAMGWLALVAVVPLWRALSPAGFAWLAAGGAAYTLGVVFYAADHRIPHGHGLWHLFVLAGSACHFTTVLVYVA